MKNKRDSELYLKTYPGLQKWINECPVCHSKGYKPDMPEHIGGADSVAVHNLKAYFRPLEVDNMGICLQCTKHFERKK